MAKAIAGYQWPFLCDTSGEGRNRSRKCWISMSGPYFDNRWVKAHPASPDRDVAKPPSTSPPRPPRSHRLLILLAAVAALLFLASAKPAYRQTTWVCPVTGSRKVQTRFFDCLGECAVTTTALADWITAEEGEYAPDWTYLGETELWLLGQRVCRVGHRPPAIFFLPEDCIAEYIASAPRSEIREFVQVMRSGSDPQQQDAVERCVQKVEVLLRAGRRD